MRFTVNQYKPVPNMPNTDAVTRADIQNLWYIMSDSGKCIHHVTLSAQNLATFHMPKVRALIHCKGDGAAVIAWYNENKQR